MSISSPKRPIVLLVEDSEDDAFFFRWALKNCGVDCTLIHVGDGALALQHLEAGMAAPDGPQPWPDIVFLDLKLPRFSGFEILSWAREQNFEPALDVAILSGSDHASDIERAMSLGATDYFVKPIPVDKLRSRLRAWMENPISSRHRPGPVTGTTVGNEKHDA